MAGTVTRTDTKLGGVRKVSLAWVSDASGDVNTNAESLGSGELLQVKFEPDGGGTQPTSLYDVTLADSEGEDVLAGEGANLSNTVGNYVVPLIGDGTTVDKRIFLDGGTLDLVVTNGGNAKGGRVDVYIR
jgi:hypothetical protein